MSADSDLQDFLANESIPLRPNRYLSLAMNEKWSSCEVLARSIRLLMHLPNLPEKIEELSRIKIGDVSSKTRYLNMVTEFLAMEFVADTLKYPIAEMESKSTPVLSPNRKELPPQCRSDHPSQHKTTKTCDFRTDDSSHSVFWEVKDYSAEAKRMEQADRTAATTGNLTPFTPSHPKDLSKWLRKMIWKEAIPKGANHLIIRMPTWEFASRPSFSLSWMREHFPELVRVGPNAFHFPNRERPFPEFFRSIFWVRSGEYIELRSSRE